MPPKFNVTNLLQNLVKTLEKRKPDLRAVNRAGQALIRQLDQPEDLERELDNDRYQILVERTRERRNEVGDK